MFEGRVTKTTKGINPDIIRVGKITPEVWIRNHTKGGHRLFH